ncbi:MAG TPA: hypothetical protein VKY90_11800 [Candidatus Dormibacteraeota bacterium]|nr:hypothetical protein [Candidatus Dormibacteraeota bacterium]
METDWLMDTAAMTLNGMLRLIEALRRHNLPDSWPRTGIAPQPSPGE